MKALRGGASSSSRWPGRTSSCATHCLARPDNIFRMVWDTSWAGGTIGYSRSDDLVHCTKQKTLAVVAHEPTTAKLRAPGDHLGRGAETYLFSASRRCRANFRCRRDERKDTTKLPRNKRLYSTTDPGFHDVTPTKCNMSPFQCDRRTHGCRMQEGGMCS